MRKKLPNVPAPFNKWIGKRAWNKISKENKKSLTDLIKLQNRLRKHFKNHKPEPYVNMNAEIEYDRMNGLR